jgi:CelD/BcsL family acetyltransferase involved in cellulose biosynthesis
MTTTEVITDPEDLAPVESRWDDLATRLRAPYCSPIWMLAWWRHLAPAGSALRVLVVRDGGDVVGVAPFYAARHLGAVRYRLLAGDISFPVEPLAAAGHEEAVAASIAEAFADIDPRPDVVTMDGLPMSRPWARRVADSWVAGVSPRAERARELPSPALVVRGRSYEGWLGSKSSNFRQQARRFRRRLDGKGATFRLAEGPDVERGVLAFGTLHRARWRSRGGSNLTHSGLEHMLADAAAGYVGTSRFRLWMLEVAGTIISAQIFVGAGGELAYWNGGFDEGWEAERPATQTMLAAIEYACAMGDDRVSFGAGADEYKYRFADEEDRLEWTRLVPITARYPLARLSLAPEDLRGVLSRRVSEETRARLKRLARWRPVQGART